MSLPSAYEAKDYEDAIYKKWESSGAFTAKANSGKKPFTIAMPPPNATGTLHLGHAVMLALQDILTRHRRMKGFEALWLPGTDHAAIATQNVVEKLIAGEGLTRQQLGRDVFLDRVREYVDNAKNTIRNQIRRMGSSCDWSRERYTFDADLNIAVNEVFIRMYEDGLIYRGYRIVNWCVRCQSTLADDEVEHEEIEGNFYHILYPFKDKKGGLTVATTRPETLLGDTAVAVNPNDKRFAKYIGETVLLPLLNREIKVIGDEYVDIETGTGALKVTPAHDPNDFEIGKRHKLEVLRVMNDDGTINEKGGAFAGLDRYTARQKIVEALEAASLLQKIEPHSHNVGHCYRCSTVIEPLTSDQWFIDVNKKVKALDGKSIREKTEEVVKDGSIEIIPDRFKKAYFNWTENLRDWCISRQIWWGHRIPVWYCDCKEPIVSRTAPEKCPHCGSANLRQDEDTLDTWFSSGLWTFSTLGWPKQTDDLKFFHPTSVLETGYDILTFWVLRMVIMTTYATGQIPFEKVYLHGLIRDREGRKMSKSLGNGIDPLKMIDEFGADALRMSMVIGNTPGNDMRLYEEKIKGYRNFTNKLWNASRFVLGILEEKGIADTPTIDTKKLTPADEWILSKLNAIISQTDEHLMNFRISEAGQALYSFLWDDFCDWYLELSKGDKQNPAVLHHVLKNILILLHPFTPFVTETIWEKLPETEGMLIHQSYPTPLTGKFAGDATEKAIAVVQSIRKLRGENKIDPAKKIAVTLYGNEAFEALKSQESDIIRLARLEDLTLQKSGEKIGGAAADFVVGIEIYLPLGGLVDFEKEKARLQKEIDALKNYIKSQESLLADKRFLAKAPEHIIGQRKAAVEEAKEKLIQLEA